MKLTNDCLICLTKQVIKNTTMSTNDTELQKEIIKKLFEQLSQITFEESAPYITWKINKFVNDKLQIHDPYEKIKKDSNILADKICKEFDLYNLIKNTEDKYQRLNIACRIAIAGNIIDFSANHDISTEEIKSTIKTCIDKELWGSTIQNFEHDIEKSKKILFLSDNAGEIVFDMIFINELPKEKITYVVKKDSIINDATMQDAIETGMTHLVKVIDSGLGIQGLILELCSKEFIQEFESADLIISKGQANYETLSHINHKSIYFLLKAKCNPVAESIGCDVGSLVLKHNNYIAQPFTSYKHL